MKIFVKDNKKIEELEVILVGDENSKEVKDVVDLLKGHTSYSKTICIGFLDDSQYILDIENVAFFESKNQQVIAYYESKEYIVKEKLYEIEEKYPDFMRISKWCVANMNRINQIYSPLNMTMNISFKNMKVTQVVTRKYLKVFKERVLGK